MSSWQRRGKLLPSTYLDVNLVSSEDNWDVFANTDQVTVPVGDVFVGDTRGDIEHNDRALALNARSSSKHMDHNVLPMTRNILVAIAQTPELFLSLW